MRQDILVKALINDEVAVCACDVSHMVEQARVIHETMPVGTIALGRMIAAGTMMASMLKNESDKITLMINGGGPAGTIMAVGNAKLHMKAYIDNPGVNTLPTPQQTFNIADAVGKKGFVTVIKDLGMREPYVGKTPVVTGEIGEDIAEYFMQSEQQNSIVYVNTWLETDMSVVNAGGLIIRPLPGCSEESLQFVESRIAQIANFALFMFSEPVEQVLQNLFGESLTVLKRERPLLLCDCNTQRLEQVLLSLGEAELDDMIEQDGGAEVVCRFCNKKYQFSGEELTELIRNAKEKSTDER